MADAVIRDLLPTDLAAAHAINQANVPAVGSVDEARLAHLLGQSVIALGAEAPVPAEAAEATGDDDTGPGAPIVGFCLVLAPGADYGSVNYRWFAERYDDFVYLDRVAVAEQARNAGIGAAMYAEVEQRATALGATWFTLEVNLRPRNDGSLRFHHRLGFEEVGRQETDYGVLVSMLAKRLR